MTKPAEGVLRNAMIRQAIRMLHDGADIRSVLNLVACSVFCQWQMREEELSGKELAQ